MNKKTEINKIFTNYDYMPFGRKCQGNGTKQRKKKEIFLDFFLGRDILRTGNNDVSTQFYTAPAFVAYARPRSMQSGTRILVR